jgi:hypothetical protein
MKRVIIILAIVVAVFAIVAVSIVDVIPPRNLTATRMQVLKRRVLQYVQAHGELPSSLAALQKMEGYDNNIQDGWKKEITYEVSTSGIVTFRSFGRDGVAGGSGEDADIVGSFPSHDKQGKWSDESVSWSEDPLQK